MKKLIALMLALMFLAPLGFSAALAASNGLPVEPQPSVWDKIVVQNAGSKPADYIEIYGNGKYESVNGDSAIFWMERTAGTSVTYTVTAWSWGYQPDNEQVTVSGQTYQEKFVTYNINTQQNNPPFADFTATVNGLNVVFDGSLSWDPDGDTLMHSWDFGDNSGAMGQVVSHSYAAAGTYSVILTVDDGRGATDTQVAQVVVQGVGGPADVVVRDLDFKTKANPGQEVTFDLQLLNNASDTAESVEATVRVLDLDGKGDDIEVTAEFGDMDKGEKQSESVTIDVPNDADDKKYTVEVEVSWQDSNGNEITKTYTKNSAGADFDKLEVVKAKHQVLISSITTDKTSYEAGDTVQVSVALANTGASDETVQIKVSADVGAQTQSATFKMKEGASTTQYLSFVIPEDTKTGNYFMVVSASYSGLSATSKQVLAVGTAASDKDTVVIVEPAPVDSGKEIPPALLALGLAALILVALLYHYRGELFSEGVRPTVIKAKGK